MNNISPIQAARAMRRANLKPTLPSYFVVMIDYGRKGCEAIVDPEITRREVVSRIKSGEYEKDEIVFIHHVDGLYIYDCTDELMEEAQSGFLTFARPDAIDRQAAAFDHARDLRKHEVV